MAKSKLEKIRVEALKGLTYLVELRSTRFVHPTLVEQMLKMVASLKKLFGKYGLVLHIDDEPNRFDVRRGEQDIVEKSKLNLKFYSFA